MYIIHTIDELKELFSSQKKFIYTVLAARPSIFYPL